VTSKKDKVQIPSLEELAESGRLKELDGSLFCPDCKSLLYPQEIDGVPLAYCRKCDTYYLRKRTDSRVIVEKARGKGEIAVISDNDHPNLVKRTCPYCGNPQMVETRIPPRWGDEDDLVIYKCPRCNKSEREGYDY